MQRVQEINLLVSGYRRRNGRLQDVKFRNSKVPRNDRDHADEPLTRELFEHLAHRANRGDRQAADRLRRILRDHPEIWQQIGDLAQHVERYLIDLVAGVNVALAESVRQTTQQMRASLLDEATDTTLEALLIEHVVVCWLELYFARTAANQPQQHKGDARFWQQRQERAHKRYVSAIRELATIRELLGTSPNDVVPMPVLSDEQEPNEHPLDADG
jgi:hypothetical protein